MTKREEELIEERDDAVKLLSWNEKAAEYWKREIDRLEQLIYEEQERENREYESSKH